jgi:Lon protease-like protein
VGLFFVKGEERNKEGQDAKTVLTDKDIESVGTLARVTRVTAASKNSFVVLMVGIRRIKLVKQVITF